MKHECNNLILSCIDFRFHEAINSWVKESNLVGNYDLVSIAGTQKNVVNLETKDFFMNQLAISVRLHKPGTVILLAHQDCGAYGGSKKFQSWHHEREMYLADLRESTELIRREFAGVEVSRFIINCDGFDEAEMPLNPRFEEI